MYRKQSKDQAGFALLIFLVIMMGLGGIVLTGITQGIFKEVKDKKFRHNERVLKEAKQALLQFAYNYPVTNGNGPGRLPCADADNDGIPDICNSFGRLPWRQSNLNLYDIRDADDERLWYVVSSQFTTHTTGSLNSDTSGTITLRDQSGNIKYDGSSVLAKYGVAAVIIAPGRITARNGVMQDRSVANGDIRFDSTADTDPGIISAINYLDLAGANDNATFTNSTADGLILGPLNVRSTDAVNDQMIVITAAEVIEVAEKATLQAYRTSVNNYLASTGSVYPWLYNYNTAALNTYLTEAVFADELTNYLGNIGRIPSIFSEYFTEADSKSIDTELRIILDASFPVGNVNFNQTFPSVATGAYDFIAGADNLAFNIQTQPMQLRFDDPDDSTPDDDVSLIGTIAATEPPQTPLTIYFWDKRGDFPADWKMCGDDGDNIPEITDCNLDGGGIPSPGVTGIEDAQILRIDAVINLPSGPDLFNITFDVSNLPVPLIVPGVNPIAATNSSHAVITATFNDGEFVTPSLLINYEWDDRYRDPLSSHPYNVVESGTLEFDSFTNRTLTLGVRYYPELPVWAFDDGWHDSVMMAYAVDYKPGEPADCVANPPCIQINGLAGINNDKVSILTIAGQHNWVDEALDNFSNDINDVFDLGNDLTDNIFSTNAGNDKVLVIQ